MGLIAGVGDFGLTELRDETLQYRNEAEVILESVENLENIGILNASTGVATVNGTTVTLTSTPPTEWLNGQSVTVTTSGAVGFSGVNFSSGLILNLGDKLRKQGTQFSLILAIATPDTVKGIYSHNDSITIDRNIANAIKYINLELKSTYINDVISIRIIGYVSGSGLIMQIYNVTTSATIYTVPLSSDTSKPTGVKTYQSHLKNEYFLDIVIDWGFSGAFLQSTTFTVLPIVRPYNYNRDSLTQFTTGVISTPSNDIDRKISTAIKGIYLEVKGAYVNDNLSIRIIGYLGGTGLIVQIYNVTTSTTIYTVLLSSDVTKPSGIKTYQAHVANEYYLELLINWSDFSDQFLQSTAYSLILSKSIYNANRTAISQFSDGIISHDSSILNDNFIKLAIKRIYYENVLSDNSFAIIQIGYNVSKLTIQIKNLTTTLSTEYLLSADTSKPSGEKTYKIHLENDSYLELNINWDIIPSVQLTSTNTIILLTDKYNYNRANKLSTVDENEELFRLNSPKKFTNGVIDLTKYPIEIGTIDSTAQDAVNNNRQRTKYAIPVFGASVVNYVIATNYTMVIQQVLVSGVKSYTLIVGGDSGTLSGTGTLTLNPRTEYIRVFFRKLSGATEIKITPEEVNSTNFSITTNYGLLGSVNNATKFTKDAFFNTFVKEMYIEGLDPTVPYVIWLLRKSIGGLYIYNKNTNTSVFVSAPSAIDVGLKGIYDTKVGNVRVMAVFDWSVIPEGYNVSNLSIDLTDKCFDINYSPTLYAYYKDKQTRLNKLVTDKNQSSIDNNYIFNSIIPHKNFMPQLMNSLNAEAVKNSTIVTYDTISHSKNGSVGVISGGVVYEFCNDEDSPDYNTNSNIFVRKIDLATKAQLSKVRIIGFGDTVFGETMTRSPYVHTGVLIGSTLRIYLFVTLTTSGVKNGYIDYNTVDNTFGTFIERTLNGVAYSYDTYYSYLKSTLGSTLISTRTFTSREISHARHTVSYGGYYYQVIGTIVGVLPYDGCFHTLIRSADGINWTTVYTFDDRSGQDDGDIYAIGNLLYIQLRQSVGNLYSPIIVFDMATNKIVASQQIKISRSRGEFFEYSGSLYLLANTDENRQFACLYKVSYANQGLEITPVLSVEGWISNWTIYQYSGKIYVFFGVQVWEFKIDQYNNSVSTTLFDLLS